MLLFSKLSPLYNDALGFPTPFFFTSNITCCFKVITYFVIADKETEIFSAYLPLT